MRTLIPSLLFCLLLSGCDDSTGKVTVYNIPKEYSKAVMPSAPPNTKQPVSTQSIVTAQWSAPENWEETDPGAMRKAKWNLTSADNHHAEVTVADFPGDVGGELANVNRWRRQLGLSAITQKDLDSQRKTIEINDSLDAVYFHLKNKDSEQSTVAAIIKVEDHSYFLKMMGDSTTVDEKEEEFLKFMLTFKLK